MGAVTEYHSSQPADVRAQLDRIVAHVRQRVPAAVEGTSYGMAALRYRGRPLFSVVATKAGYTAFPFSAEVVRAVVGGAGGLDATKGGIRFTDARPLPDVVLDALVDLRRAEIDEALG